MNIERIQKLLDHVTAHPEEHDQSTWAQKNSCGTQMCLAGHAVQMFGSGLDWAEVDEVDEVDPCFAIAGFDNDGRYIPEAARRLLDLTEVEADCLFYNNASIAELWRIANDITYGRLELPLTMQG